MVGKMIRRILAWWVFWNGAAYADSYTQDCDQFGLISIGDLAFNNNIWNPDVPGEQCISVDSTGSTFNVTWQWETGNLSNPVHSYPYVRFGSPYIPGRLQNLTTLRLNGSWNMFQTGDESAALGSSGATANAAIDMFLDMDPTNATQASAQYEVMIWFATYGYGQPYGGDTGLRHTTPVQPGQNGTFQLLSGTKDNGQVVLTWLAAPPVLQFDIDILSFFQVLETNNLMASSNLTLGVVQFGTETFHANESITFMASDFSMNVTYGEAVTTTSTSSTSSSQPTLPPTSSAPPAPTTSSKPSEAYRLTSSGSLLMVVVGMAWQL